MLESIIKAILYCVIFGLLLWLFLELSALQKKVSSYLDSCESTEEEPEEEGPTNWVLIPQIITPKLNGKQYLNHRKHALKLAAYTGNAVYFGVHRTKKGHLMTFFIEVEPHERALTKGIYCCVMPN